MKTIKQIMEEKGLEIPKVVKYPIIEYDKNGNEIHYKNSNGHEYWKEYDKKGNKIHHKNSDGYEHWYEYDKNGNLIHYKSSDGHEYWEEKHNKLELKKGKYYLNGTLLEEAGK